MKMPVQRIGYKLFIALVVFCSFLFSANAQQSVIKGRVAGVTEPGLIVNLLARKDSSFVKVAICDSAGRYELAGLKDGVYLLSIRQLGYLPYYSAAIQLNTIEREVSMPDIQLIPSANDLGEVSVVAKKPFVQRKIDRVVVNPDALISNAGSTSLEMLEKAPGVLVDINGNISLKGKSGVVVLIDDKPTYMSASDLANFLRSMPASSVDLIEIMTNPPAKFDASGNAGVINIRLKKNMVKGINGGVNLSYGQGRYMRTNNSFNLNYRVNKVNIFGNIGWNRNNTYQDLFLDRFYFTNTGVFNSGFKQNSYIKRGMTGQTARVGMDYYMNNKSTFGIVLSGFINPSTSTVNNTANVTDANDNLTSRVVAENPSEREWKNGGINLNYSYKPNNRGAELSANADYISYASIATQTLVNQVYDPSNSLIGSSTLSSSLPANINIQTLKVDYVTPLKTGGRFDAGVKTSFVDADNTANFYDVVNNVSTPNYQFSNSFIYKENINAVYANYSRDWKRLSLQLGFRMENTNISGHQLGNPVVSDSSFTRHYTNLFPTFYLLYRADTLQKHQWGLTVGRRINRPNYQDLNPFTYPLDRFTYYAGNPFLQPTFSYGVELSHTFKNMITTSVEYNVVNDLIQETNEQRNNIFYSRPGNFGRQIVYGIDLNATVKLSKWWTLQLYTEYKNLGYRSQIYGQQLDESKWYWSFAPTNQFVITPDLSAELSGSYQTRILVGQFLTIPVWQLRAGLSQRIMKGKGSVRLNVSDLLYTNQPGGDIRNITNAKANWKSFLDSRVLSLTFSYRFNKGKSLNARQSGGSEAEKGRVKTN